ncbi:hypothetical protein DH86_00004089 [Scytalidium sp. 3C]|nr:hypothetical protein DH86_00004089 [Scytalidium sp. 3C]
MRPEQAAAVKFSTGEAIRKLGADNPLLNYFIPDFSVGCRRTTPGNGYLEALTKDNVRTVTEQIVEITPEGVKTTTGKFVKVDILICATGFDMSFCPRYSLVGQNGLQLSQQWAKKPEAYMSMAVPNFPNHFKGIKSVMVKKVAVDNFVKHVDVFMKRTAWSTNCRSWFKNGNVDGPVIALHPGSRIHWFHMLDQPRYEDFEWTTWNQNPFAYLGNGFSIREAEGRDLAYYFDNCDEGFEGLKY